MENQNLKLPIINTNRVLISGEIINEQEENNKSSRYSKQSFIINSPQHKKHISSYSKSSSGVNLKSGRSVMTIKSKFSKEVNNEIDTGYEIQKLESSLKFLESNTQSFNLNHNNLKNERTNELYNQIQIIKATYRRALKESQQPKVLKLQLFSDLVKNDRSNFFKHLKNEKNNVNHIYINQVNNANDNDTIKDENKSYSNNNTKLVKNNENNYQIKNINPSKVDNYNDVNNNEDGEENLKLNKNLSIKNNNHNEVISNNLYSNTYSSQLWLLEQCIPLYKKILFLSPKNLNILIEVSDLYLQLNDISSAITYLKRAKELNPGNDAILSKLESLQFAKGVIFLKDDTISIHNFFDSDVGTIKSNAFLTETLNDISTSLSKLYFR